MGPSEIGTTVLGQERKNERSTWSDSVAFGGSGDEGEPTAIVGEGAVEYEADLSGLCCELCVIDVFGSEVLSPRAPRK